MRLTLSLLLAPLALTVVAADQSFRLTRNGQPAATIVIAAKPTPSATFAAAELQEHVRHISGAVLPIVRDNQPVTGPRILVGESQATRALHLRGRDFASQEYLIRFTPDTLVLMGRDSSPAAPAGLPAGQRTAGKFGGGLAFGGDKRAFVVSDLDFDDTEGTLEAWVWIPAEKPTARHGTILRLDGADPWTYHIIQRDMGTGALSYMTYDGQQVRGVGAPDPGEGWHHVVGTYSTHTGKMAFWMDGAKCGEAEYRRTTCKGSVLGIGGMAADSGNLLEGRIDEVRLSKVVRDVQTQATGGPYEPDADTLALFHFDEASGLPVNPSVTHGAAPPPDLFGDNGTLYAVYDFLERHCGVRWYAPTDLGLVCPTKPTLVVQGIERRHRPAMIHRWITPTALYLPGPPERVPGRELHLWKLRNRIGGQAFWVCHSFEGCYDRFLKTHPDWFAQGYGERRPPQMCYTNPEFIAQVVQDARDYFDGKGKHAGATAEGDVFGLVPMDNNSWCKCPRCQAELNQAEMSNQQFNNGKASDYVFGFVNKVAREVRKTHPDKWIGALAYSDYAYYPTRFRVEPNVVVQLCLHTRNWWCPSMEANDRRVIREWRTADPDRPLYLWLYYNFPALNAQYGGWRYFPGFFAHSVVEQMKLYHDNRFQGIFMEHSSEFGQTYLMDQLEFYVTLKLADDPSLDGNRLIERFFAEYYGAAARPMRALYDQIEATFTDPRNYPPEIQQSPGHQHQTAELAWEWLGTPERMAAMQKLMDQALAAARTDMEKRRVAAFKGGLWDYMVAGRQEYDAIKAAKQQAVRQWNVPAVGEAGGDATRVDWSAVPDAGPWVTLAGGGTTRRLQALVAHDGAYLYVRLTEWTDPAKLVSGANLWDGDDFELIFAADRRGYHQQLVVAPNGRTVALSWQGDTQEMWDAGARVVSETSASDQWTVSVALPLEKLLPGGLTVGQRFYANFYRASPGATDLLAWAPTFANGFHDTERLPELILTTPAQGALPGGAPSVTALLTQALTAQEKPMDPALIRERSEWSNIWWDVANDRELPRVLLIGDSISVGYGGTVIEKLAGTAHVDRLSNSRNILDPIHLKETRLMLEDCRYAAIHFNNGLHGFHLTTAQYAQGLRAYVKLLRELAPDTPLIWASSTPITVNDHPEQLAESNGTVLERNAAAAALMAELGVATNDLYTLVVAHPEWKTGDGYHFNGDGQRAQGEAVAAAIRRAMGAEAAE